LTAAAKMDAKMSTSCSSREAPAQASAPESTTAAALAGCGDSSSPHRISDSAGKDGGFASLSPSAGGPPLSPESARATVRRGARGRSEEQEEEKDAGVRSLGCGGELCGRRRGAGRRDGATRVPASVAIGGEEEEQQQQQQLQEDSAGGSRSERHGGGGLVAEDVQVEALLIRQIWNRRSKAGRLIACAEPWEAMSQGKM
jgi:hypothetical protein